MCLNKKSKDIVALMSNEDILETFLKDPIIKASLKEAPSSVSHFSDK